MMAAVIFAVLFIFNFALGIVVFGLIDIHWYGQRLFDNLKENDSYLTALAIFTLWPLLLVVAVCLRLRQFGRL